MATFGNGLFGEGRLGAIDLALVSARKVIARAPRVVASLTRVRIVPPIARHREVK